MLVRLASKPLTSDFTEGRQQINQVDGLEVLGNWQHQVHHFDVLSGTTTNVNPDKLTIFVRNMGSCQQETVLSSFQQDATSLVVDMGLVAVKQLKSLLLLGRLVVDFVNKRLDKTRPGKNSHRSDKVVQLGGEQEDCNKGDGATEEDLERLDVQKKLQHSGKKKKVYATKNRVCPSKVHYIYWKRFGCKTVPGVWSADSATTCAATWGIVQIWVHKGNKGSPRKWDNGVWSDFQLFGLYKGRVRVTSCAI